MTTTRFLPEHIREKVLQLPEWRYGTTHVTVVLDDGTRIRDVYVAWGHEVVRVGKSTDVMFDPRRVVDVEPEPA
jgi:hypothetical protein